MKVLHISSIVGKGGVGRFVGEIVRGIDDHRIIQDVLSVCRPVYYELPCCRFGPLVQGRGLRASLVGALRLESFLRENSYDVVHIHTNNSAGFAYAEAARRAGVSCRIVHSHNTSLGVGSYRAKYVLDSCIKGLLSDAPTIRLACSRGAGEFLFGRADFEVIANGIDTSRFAFNREAREDVRGRYGLEDRLVIGVCSNLSPEKNVLKCLHVLDALLKVRSGACLLIVGAGDEEANLRREAKSLSVSDNVVWAGAVSNPESYYSAMDCLLMPSLFEGFPLALVEAQANGLPTIASDRITREAVLTDLVRMLDIYASDREWAESVLPAAESGANFRKRETKAREVAAAGYDKRMTLDAVRSIYMHLNRNLSGAQSVC